jgi:hypothetical protein
VADGGAGFGFTIALDRDITCRADGPHGDQADCPPSSTLSLTYLVFERPDATGAEGAGDDEGATSPAPNASPAPPPPRITDVFMQREMSVDECLRRYGAPPADYKRVLDAIPLEALRFGSTGVHDPERATQHAVAAEAINEAWRTGDAAPALAHLADDFTRVNALTGSILHGKPAFAAMLGKVFQKYSLMWHSSCIAVTPGNKAVTFFTASAQYENEFCQPSGEDGWERGRARACFFLTLLTLAAGGVLTPPLPAHTHAHTHTQTPGQSILIFDADNKISHAIEFTTPLPGMKSQLTAGGGGGGAGHRAQAETMAGEAGGGEGGPGEMEERQQVEVGGKQQEVGPAAGEAAAQAEEVRSPEA